MYHQFSIAETLATAWSIFRKNFITIIVYSVVIFFVLLVLGFILGVLFTAEDFYVDMFVSLIILVFQAYTTLGLYKLIFTLIDSEFYEFHISQIFPKFSMMVSYLVVELMFATIFVTYGIILKQIDNELLKGILFYIGIVIGLFLILRIMFFNSFIADDDSGPIESLKQSFAITRTHSLQIVAILAIIIVLIAVPAKVSQYFPPTSLLIIFTYPFVNIFLMVTYRKLIYSNKDIDDLEGETV